MTDAKQILCVVTLAFLFLSTLSAEDQPAEETPVSVPVPTIEKNQDVWVDGLQIAHAQRAGRPLALLFSIENCVWCHRMLDESKTSQAVRGALKQVQGVHVRAEKYRVLTAQLGIESYPTLVLINRKNELVRVFKGYLPADQLATTLRILARHGDGEGQRPVRLDADSSLQDALESADPGAALLRLLGVGAVEQRVQLRRALLKRRDTETALWALLSDAHLGVRVDAAAILAQWYPDSCVYDPFAAEKQRHKSAVVWHDQSLIEVEDIP